MTDNKTYWALKKREWASRDEQITAKGAKRARGFMTRRMAGLSKPERTVVGPPEEVAPEPSYRDLQAEAKELDIPANQSAEDLKAEIEKAAKK